MEVNEGKKWMKNRMKKGVKIGLSLALKNCSPKRIASRVN